MTKEFIQSIYNTFSKYSLNEKITGCYCDVCMTEDYSRYLHTTSLKTLTATDLQGYISCVGIAEKDCNDFKYFLPRILELIYQDIELNEPNEFYIFIWGVLEGINYLSWEENEQSLILNFFKKYWEVVKQPEDVEIKDLTIANIKEIVFKHFAL